MSYLFFIYHSHFSTFLNDSNSLILFQQTIMDVHYNDRDLAGFDLSCEKLEEIRKEASKRNN